MHKSVKNIIDLSDNVNKKIEDLNYKNYNPQIIAVSKTFSMENILPLIEYGHEHFGENKVQEALNKWSDIKSQKPNIKLHMIGKLQSNKVKQAVSIFDFIHSVDSIKLANKISEEQKKQNKNLIKKNNTVQKEILEYQKFIEKNFENVGEDFVYKARSLHYNNNKHEKGIYGTASKEEINELREEGINAETIPWIEDKKN